MASAKFDLVEELSCAVCSDILDDPKVLPCSHVFCRKCLQPLVTSKKSVSCPVCRKVHPVPKGKAGKLISDLRTKNIIETRLFPQRRVCLLQKIDEVAKKLSNESETGALHQLEANWENFRKKNAEQKKASYNQITELINLLQQKKIEVLKVYDDYDKYARDRITHIQQMKLINDYIHKLRDQINDMDLNTVNESLYSVTKYDGIVSDKNNAGLAVIPDTLGEVYTDDIVLEIKYFASPITRRRAGNDADVELVFSQVGDVREYENMSPFSTSKILAEGNVEIHRHRGGLYQLQVVNINDKSKSLNKFDWNNRAPSAQTPTMESMVWPHVPWMLVTGDRELMYSTYIDDNDRRRALKYTMIHAFPRDIIYVSPATKCQKSGSKHQQTRLGVFAKFDEMSDSVY